MDNTSNREAARDDQRAADDATSWVATGLAQRGARPPRVRLRVVDLDRREALVIITKAARLGITHNSFSMTAEHAQ